MGVLCIEPRLKSPYIIQGPTTGDTARTLHDFCCYNQRELEDLI